ncbi:CamS family sex pheromone protein [Metabacillus iocasae]|uniref:Protein involved in sex pheromone biosynthesis n=1 Tax=Priestia iocasae TaxID=2291674 RepID=A0ABS2QXW0_9BACI|nr:CamS family sex pheromone protein [Metabacillus iocasae]MBM7704252.1 protein involved in sex pheromone biosynthesis [Metabacillus iocasae]
MKKVFLLSLIVVFITSACAPSFSKEEEVVQQTNEDSEKAIIPKFNISDNYYRTILPFKPGEARGLVVGNMNNRLDIQEFESGLMRMAQSDFSPDKYLFQEGQYLDRTTIRSWLSRKQTDAQFAETKKKDSKAKNEGLNPVMSDEGTLTERNEKSPQYLGHILEQNYLIKDGEDKVRLGGVMIGLAMNSVHYYNQEQGYPREVPIKQEVLEKEGKAIADEIVSRMRKMDELKEVPITVALFKQMPKSSITPGNFFALGTAGKGDTKVGKWEDIKEKYYLFPSQDATADHRDDAMKFNEFKARIEDYFPNFTSVIGKGFYKDDQLQQLSVEIPIQFYGRGEVVGFTQYVTGLMLDHFPPYMETRVYINSVGGQEAVIIREQDSEKPFVHIYE